jgi:LmbE family N-acetylglucosaminyl deacetylase
MGYGWKLLCAPDLCGSPLQGRHKGPDVSGALAPEVPSRRAKSRALGLLLSALVPVATIAVSTSAQSLPETVEAINKARVSTRILFITAHPDDEWASLLTYLSRGLNADVALLTITRGQGGQNAIGPEQGAELGTIRTEELLAADKHYGVRQFFTRAMDTGYVKTPEQAQKIWGGVALEDMVRVIRTFRPQVVINGWGGVHGGHGHHQESGILTPQAVAAAAEPKMFPEQIAEGLPAWTVPLEVRPARENNVAGAVPLPINDVSPLWGKSYVDMGMEGHAQHRSQGTPSFFGNPFFRRPVSLVRENEKGDPVGGFDAKLLAEPLPSLSEKFPQFREALAPALSNASAKLEAARKEALALDRTAAAHSLAEAGKEIEQLRNKLSSQKAATQLVWELDQVKEKIDLALNDDVALPVLADADRHELVAGENFSVEINFLGQPAVPLDFSLDKKNVLVPSGWNAEVQKNGEGRNYKVTIGIPATAAPPDSPADAILPYPTALVRVAPRVEIAGYSFAVPRTVDSMKAATTGIETYPLELVPAVTLTPDPQQIMVPAERASQPVTLVARVRYHGTKPEKVRVGVDVSSSWQVLPEGLFYIAGDGLIHLSFSGPGDQLIRFTVTPPAHVAPGAYPLHPFAQLDGQKFTTSLEPIPSLPTRDWSEPADVTVHVLNLVVPAHLRVGYVAASNDPIPDTLRQIGIQVDMLDEVALAFEDLSRYNAIVVGIRAYDLRPDLMRSNPRLLDYVQQGGSLIVQYQRDPDWVSAMPYPAKMPPQTSRVTDANSPVHFLAPDSPLLNSPNKITLADFEGWEQERGLYFLGSFDSHYQPVLGLTDAGEPETNGSLVYARYGKGVYIYTGLSFFRELPSGIPGAYRLFVNLLSQTQQGAAHD